jgi:ABC-type multidrug transport system ATPase subunit
MDISDRVVVLDYGRKLADGTPDEVRNNADVIEAYLGVSHNRDEGGDEGGDGDESEVVQPEARHARSSPA